MALTDRMKEARKTKGLTQESIARKIGVAKSTYTGYEKGNSEPNMLILSRIMNVLEVDAIFLFQDEMDDLRNATATPQEMENIIKKYRLLDPYGKEAVDSVLNVEYRRCEEARAETIRKERVDMEAAQDIPEKIIQLRFKVPGYSMPMSAGTGQEAGQEYPEDYILTKEQPRGTSYIATVSGNSMEPTYCDGDLLFIHACEEIARGQIGVFFMDGQQWVKELGDGELISHNPDYDPRPVTEDVRCQGLVLGVCDESYFE